MATARRVGGAGRGATRGGPRPRAGWVGGGASGWAPGSTAPGPSAAVPGPPDSPATPIFPPPPPVPVPLEGWFSNDGIDSASAHDGDFDGSGYTFPAEHLPLGQTATV